MKAKLQRRSFGPGEDHNNVFVDAQQWDTADSAESSEPACH